MRTRRRTTGGEAEVNMTPMLDIVFILLIFFIVTATFLQEEGKSMIGPPQPEDENPPESQNETILIQVDANDRIFINARITDVARVTANVQKQIAENGGQSAVLIESHPDSSHGVVTQVFDQSQQANPAGVVVKKPETRT